MEQQEENPEYEFQIIALTGKQFNICSTGYSDLRMKVAIKLNTCAPCVILLNSQGHPMSQDDLVPDPSSNKINLNTIVDTDCAQEMMEWTERQWKNAITDYVIRNDTGIFDALDMFASENCAKNMTIEALIECARRQDDRTPMVHLLFHRGIYIEGDDGAKILTAASHNGHLEIVKGLFDHGLDVHGQDGRFALRCAFNSWNYRPSNAQIIGMLLDRNVDVTGEDGKNALCVTVCDGHTHIVQMLLDEVTITDEFGLKMLQLASEKRHASIVEVLLDYGVDPTNEESGSILKQAFLLGHTDIVQVFLNRKKNHVERGNSFFWNEMEEDACADIQNLIEWHFREDRCPEVL